MFHKFSFEISSSSNLINTFDDLFRHTYTSPIYHMKSAIKHTCENKIKMKIILVSFLGKTNYTGFFVYFLNPYYSLFIHFLFCLFGFMFLYPRLSLFLCPCLSLSPCFCMFKFESVCICLFGVSVYVHLRLSFFAVSNISARGLVKRQPLNHLVKGVVDSPTIWQFKMVETSAIWSAPQKQV